MKVSDIIGLTYGSGSALARPWKGKSLWKY
jgi:hypothetical protein